MRVPVMMRVSCAASHLLRRSDAALERFAADVLELDGGVADLELLAENSLRLDENAGALRRRNVGDRDVAGQGARVANPGTRRADRER